MSDWLKPLAASLDAGDAVVLVTVVETQGSAPREPGARMLVGGTVRQGTIGGGELERVAIEEAAALLNPSAPKSLVKRYTLGPQLGQCCGGVATLMLERVETDGMEWVKTLNDAHDANEVTALISCSRAGPPFVATTDTLDEAGLDPQLARSVAWALDNECPVYQNSSAHGPYFVDVVKPSDFHIVLFGAGHVGKALVEVAAHLECVITWVDSRRSEFPRSVADNVTAVVHDAPEHFVDEAPSGAYHLIMTHSHPLDLAVCERVLKNSDFRYCGLIGSRSKRLKFEKRLKLRGVPEERLERLVCPIGVDGIKSKRPQDIAVAVAAQLLQYRELSLSGSLERTGANGLERKRG